GVCEGLRLLRGALGRGRRDGGPLGADRLAVHHDPAQPQGLRAQHVLGVPALLQGRWLLDDLLDPRVEIAGALPCFFADGRSRGANAKSLRAPRQDPGPAREVAEVERRLGRLGRELDWATAPPAGLPGGRQARRVLHDARRVPAGVRPLHHLPHPQQRVARGQKGGGPARERRPVRRANAQGVREDRVHAEPGAARRKVQVEGRDGQGPLREGVLHRLGAHQGRRAKGERRLRRQGRGGGHRGLPRLQRRVGGLLARARLQLRVVASQPAVRTADPGDPDLRQ
ncbi:unnamed protein product, partial [Prorocentrum cordatum]